MLRSAITTAPVVALTATADKATQKKIVKSLALRRGYTSIHVSPNRKNVTLHVVKVNKLVPSVHLRWLFTLVQSLHEKLPKTIIYCKTIAVVAEIYRSIVWELGKDALISNTTGEQASIVGMFHRKSLEKNKKNLELRLGTRRPYPNSCSNNIIRHGCQY